MRKIDGHVHIVPAGLKGRVDERFKVRVEPYGIKRFADGSVYQFMPDYMADSCFEAETLIKCMDNQGIERAVVMQSLCLSFNEEVVKAVRRYPGRLAGAMIIEPRDPGCLKDMEYWRQQGLRVMKLELSTGLGFSHPNLYPGFKLDSELGQLIWRKAAETGITVTIDPGPIDSPGYQVEELHRIIPEYPELRMVICHLGFPEIGLNSNKTRYQRWQRMLSLAKYDNVWFDISAVPALFSQEGYPYQAAINYLRELIDKYGADKPIWGSDIPGIWVYATYPQMVEMWSNSTLLDQKEKELLFRENAQKAYFQNSINICYQ
jgi:predicted TIM-barrel fold metal-dependent hydrolase